MAAVESMGEVDEINSKGEDEVVTNGEIICNTDEENTKIITKPLQESCDEPMEVEDVEIEDTKDEDDDEEEEEEEEGDETQNSEENEQNERVVENNVAHDKDNEVVQVEDPLIVAPDTNTDSDDNRATDDIEEETVNADDNKEEGDVSGEEGNISDEEGAVSDDKCEKIVEKDKNDGKDEKEEKDEDDEKVENDETEKQEDIDKEKVSEKEDVEKEKVSEKKENEDVGNKKVCTEDKDVIEIHEILDDDEEEEIHKNNKQNGISQSKLNSANETIELNDSGDTDGEGDVMIVEETIPKANGPTEKRKSSFGQLEIIDLDKPAKKAKIESVPPITPRRSSRNINRQKSYAESDKEEEDEDAKTNKESKESEESDIEEVLPEDPLAVTNAVSIEKVNHKPSSKPSSNSSTIVVKDTKKLVEIASKPNSSTMTSGKKEPTLVIIDTNSILSGRGPVPVTPKPQQSTAKVIIPKTVPTVKSQSQPASLNISHSPYPTLLPVALPAQGMYPPNMRATITPIPMNTSHASSIVTKPVPPPQPQPPPLLPTLTDDMFVVEAPSFIVPYVYEKPPKKEFKEFVKDIEKEIIEQKRIEETKKEEKVEDKKDTDGEKGEENEKESNEEENVDKKKTDDKEDKKEDKEDDDNKVEEPSKTEADSSKDTKKPYSYFESPLGKFFIDIGMSLVQEFVQTDLLKQQKRKRDREGGQNSETNKTIQSLLKNLEYTKENNSAFKMATKKCEYCHFKTESALVLANHLETPHMKNYVYKCNFCTYEVRSPHDILFHMEAEHAVKGRLERAPSFHQCSNCPFEDNQKGKLSRHLVACSRKFKPERNLEPPIDWEPPAKIPRVPKLRQQGHQGLNPAAIQGMSKTYQFLTKMQLQNTNALNRGRGRPTLGAPIKPLMRPTGMVYKQTMSGGSVLVPANYQLGGNQVFQVLGGQELGGRLGHPGQMAFLPNMSSASSTFSSMQQQQVGGQQQNQQQKKPPHQPSISITPLPRASTSTVAPIPSKPGDTNAKNSFVICEICDGYIKDLEQLRNHMQWIHKIKIHPKMIYNRPPLNCQKCQFRFFTDQGLERHLLGSHGLVTSSMQDAANKSKDAGRCPVCGRVYQWKLLNHVARDHNMTLKPAHLSYKCTVCTATFGMYKQFENHVYSAHSVVAKRVIDKKGNSGSPSSSTSTTSNNKDMMKPLKINDEITIIPQPNKSGGAGTSNEGSPSSTGSNSSRTGTPSTSKNAESESSSSRAERVTRRTANNTDD